jgi:hypothetical protein
VPYHHRHAVEPPRRRGIPLLGVIAIALVAAVALVGAGIAVAVAIRPPSAPADTRPAANGAAGNARLGGDLAYRAGKIDATYTLTAGPKLTLTPSGSARAGARSSGFTAAVQVAAGDVFLTDDNFVLVTSEGRRFEPDVSFLFDGGLRGARAAAGQRRQRSRGLGRAPGLGDRCDRGTAHRRRVAGHLEASVTSASERRSHAGVADL